MATDDVIAEMQREFMRVQEQIDQIEGALTGRIWDAERRILNAAHRIKIYCLWNMLLVLLLVFLILF